MARKAAAICVFFLLGLFCVQVPGTAVLAADGMPIGQRFFRSGNGHIHIRNMHNGTEADVRLLRDDGSIDEKARAALDRVFGVAPASDGHISLRLLFLLDYFSDKVAPGSTIELYSGYRAPAYNRKLRAAGRIAAPTSTHMDAMAIDFAIRGVNGKDLWETIRQEECCGVGHYGGATVHLDCGRARFWEAATAKVDSGESRYNRRMHFTTEYDRYLAGEEVRLALSSISDYPFGVKKAVRLIGEGQNAAHPIGCEIMGRSECALVRDRADGRSISVRLPDTMPSGRYRVEIDFCSKPSAQMPSSISSNIIEVVGAE